MRGVSALMAMIFSLGDAEGHGSPYVVFSCRFLGAAGHPVSGLTVALDLVPDGAGRAAQRAEAPIEAGLARITVNFPGDFQGSLRMRVLDAKRRVIAPARAEEGGRMSFAYAHRAGTGLEEAFAAGPRSTQEDPFKDGEAALGSDGRVYPGSETARAFTVDWAPARMDAAEAEEAARGGEMDRGIEAEFRARLEAIRRKREGR